MYMHVLGRKKNYVANEPHLRISPYQRTLGAPCPRIPVELSGFRKLDAPFLRERRTRGLSGVAWQESGVLRLFFAKGGIPPRRTFHSWSWLTGWGRGIPNLAQSAHSDMELLLLRELFRGACDHGFAHPCFCLIAPIFAIELQKNRGVGNCHVCLKNDNVEGLSHLVDLRDDLLVWQ
jgi:hypothetical protein